MVYVISEDGQPLMPTTRHGKVRRLLKSKQAKVINRCPFTIKLLYETTSFVQETNLGVDTGSKHAGFAVYSNSKILYQSQLELRDDIKSKIENQKAFMPIFYEENVLKHDWSKIHEKFLIWETNKPMLIGDIPYVPIKSECKRGKILEEFVFPLDRNHLLIYAQEKPNYLEVHLYQTIILSIIDGASEKIACNDLEYLKNEMKFAKKRIEEYINGNTTE